MKAVLILLDKMKPKHMMRHDPVLIARSMSALVNSSVSVLFYDYHNNRIWFSIV